MEVQPTAAIAGTTNPPVSVFDEDEDISDPNDMESNNASNTDDKIPSTLLPGEDDVMNNFVEVDPLLTPIELGSFTAVAEITDAKLEWLTLTELNNSHFEIERSDNGVDYEFVSRIESQALDGNSDTELTYSFTDKDAGRISESLFYRIKQIDLGPVAQFAFTPVRIVTFENIDLESKIFPNPVNIGSLITIQSNDKINSIDIYDANGALIQSVIEDGQTNTTSVSTSDIAGGLYIVVINGKESIKLTLQ